MTDKQTAFDKVLKTMERECAIKTHWVVLIAFVTSIVALAYLFMLIDSLTKRHVSHLEVFFYFLGFLASINAFVFESSWVVRKKSIIIEKCFDDYADTCKTIDDRKKD